jgi:integrase/recombinase XerD
MGILLSVKNIEDYLEKEKVATLLDHARTCNLRDYLMLRILWRTGIRVSELLSIRPQDLEPHNQVVNITKAKGNKQRRVMLDPETLDLLSEYISIHNIPESQPVFTLSSVQVWNIVKKYGRMINVDIHPHTFRHSFAIHLVRSGLDLRRVQQLLGHSNLNTTQVYLQFNDQDLCEGYNKIAF